LYNGTLEVTLNITIVSSTGIHQSADFRISRTERDGNGNWIELQPNSSKIVPLHFQKWFGFLTYCGIGLWRGKPTDQYAVEWLSDLSQSECSFGDVVETIRLRGSDWVVGINRGRKHRFNHTFILAGYENQVPHYAVISNIQSLTKYFPATADDLIAESRATRDLHLFVTGIGEAVSGPMRSKLKAMVRSGAAPNVIRHEMAEINRIASQSVEAKNGISPACLAYSIDQYGAGHGEVHGDVQGPVMPKTVMGGIDISHLLAEILKNNPGAKLVQTGYGTTASSQAEREENIQCELQFKEKEVCTIEEIGSINEYWLSLQDINDVTWVVGHGFFPFGNPFNAFVLNSERQILNLGTLGGAVSHAFSINANNQVVGSAEVDHRVTHAFLWHESTGMRDLGTLGGSRSVARDINNHGIVVGESFLEPGEPRQEFERAFLWSADAGMINLGASFDGWSRAVAINNHGVVIGCRRRGSVVCGFIWTRERGALDIVGSNGLSFYPAAINDDGVVIGEGDAHDGRRRAFTWTLNAGLRILQVPDEFHPSDIDNEGNILGNIYSQPWQQPGLYEMATQRYLSLPSAYAHQTSVKAMNGLGVIVGEARTSSAKHVHPLIWRLPR
jgi:probable HAF family extracellular repeat protein